MLKSAIVNYTIERSKLTTKKDILGLTLENKTRQQEARRVAWVAAGDAQNHHICQHISVYVRLPSTFS